MEYSRIEILLNNHVMIENILTTTLQLKVYLQLNITNENILTIIQLQHDIRHLVKIKVVYFFNNYTN